MPDFLVRSTTGSDANSGQGAWANAKATWVGAAAAMATGDRLLMSQAHAESNAVPTTINFPGTYAAPNQIICVDDSVYPPTTRTTGGQVSTTGASDLTINGSIYVYGTRLNCGSGASAAQLTLHAGYGVQDNGIQHWEDSEFRLLTTGGASYILCRSDGAHIGRIIWENAQIQFNAAGQLICLNGTTFHARGGGVLSGGVSPTVLTLVNAVKKAVFDGFDLSNLSTTFDLATGDSGGSNLVFRHPRLPVGWVGDAWSVNPQTRPDANVELYAHAAAGSTYSLRKENNLGRQRLETTIIKIGGAVEGVTAHSMRIDTLVDAEYPLQFFRSLEIASLPLTAGVAVTLGVDILHDTNVAAGQGAGTAFAFQNDEIWLEAQYLGTSGQPKSSFIDNVKVLMATAADQASSTVDWNSTGMTTPLAQRLAVSFTPQVDGPALLVICAAKASKTFYACPKVVQT